MCLCHHMTSVGFKCETFVDDLHEAAAVSGVTAATRLKTRPGWKNTNKQYCCEITNNSKQLMCQHPASLCRGDEPQPAAAAAHWLRAASGSHCFHGSHWRPTGEEERRGEGREREREILHGSYSFNMQAFQFLISIFEVFFFIFSLNNRRNCSVTVVTTEPVHVCKYTVRLMEMF